MEETVNRIMLPYGRDTIELHVPELCPCQVLTQKEYEPGGSALDIVNEALMNPIGSPGLGELTKAAEKILIITNDNTRPMHSRLTIPAMIDAFHFPEDRYEITVLIATGLHRAMTQEEIKGQFGEGLCSKYRIVNHSATDAENLVSFGKMSTGSELFLNRLVSESDLVIAEGFVEPHFFAGFSGGRKSIFPGVAGESSVLANHKPEHIGSHKARQAVLEGNPVHDELVEAVGLSGLGFILNIAYGKGKEIVKAFAGDPVEAHLEGCRFVEGALSVRCEPADIVVTSNNGYPLDRNLYQTVKGIDTASKVVKEGGVIVMAARCEDGVGHGHFQELIQSCGAVRELYEEMSKPPSEMDKWQVQVLARVLMRNKVILVSDGIERETAERLFFTYAKTMDEAMEMALADAGSGASVCVIPDGPVIIPKVLGA